jgi:hypothetical protein
MRRNVNAHCVTQFAKHGGMDDAADRLRWARTSRSHYTSGTDAARAYGWTVSTYLGHENGDRAPSRAAAEKYAKAYRVRWEWLLTGNGAPIAPNVVTVVGRVGAGAEIDTDFDQTTPEGLYDIEVPVEIPHDAIAFEVAGDSMWPRYDAGDVVICWREGTDISQITGWEAAVKLSDGRRFLKRIMQGAMPKTYDLESYNAPAIRGVKLEWVSRVNLVVRRGEWKLLNGKSAKAISRKAAAAR